MQVVLYDEWEFSSLKIKTNSLITCICESIEGLRNEVHWVCAGQGPPQRLICHDLLKIRKYDYTYKVKYNFVTLENE